jgi:hypothetical protein
METKSQRLSMPATERRMQETVLSILRLPRLLELKVTKGGIEVKRSVEGDEEIVPRTLADVAEGIEPDVPDADFLLKHIELHELSLDRERHPLTTLVKMCDHVKHRGLFCVGWYVANGDSLDWFLGQDKGTVPNFLFGIPVHYVPDDQVPEGRLVLVGAKSQYAIDASYGISADIGEM